MTDATEPSTEDLLCLHLLTVADDRDRPPRAAATPGVLDALDVDESAITDHFAVISGLSDLVDRGLVAKRTAAVEGENEGRTVYELTETGREHAGEIRERLSGREVTLRSADGAETATLGEAADRLGESLATAAARLQEDVLVVEDIEGGADPDAMPFVDRTDELDRLESRYESAASHADPLLIDGEPGVGKTQLVAEFGDRVTERGGTVLSGRCRPGADAPYDSFLDAVRGLQTPHRDGVVEALTGAGTERAVDAPGGDSTAVPGGPDPGDADATASAALERRRQSLFDTVAAELSTLTDRGPVVLALDDVQRVGRPTAALVAHLASELADAPFLVVGTVSPTEPDPAATFEAALDDYDLSATTVTLGPFDREAGATLVHRLVGTRRVPTGFVEDVYDHTGGNPLFLTESVDRMLDTGVLRPDADVFPDSVDDLPVPATVEATVRERLGALDGGTRELVELAGLAGGTVPVSVLATASDLDAPAVAERTELLVDSRLWERAGDGTVRFVSDVVREAARESLDDPRRRNFHRRLAEAYRAAEDGSGNAAAAAHHFDRADMDAAALDASLAAADHATDVYAHEVAVEACERAVDLARETGDRAALVEALEALGDTYRVVGEYEEATRCYRYVRERADDPETVRRTHRKAGLVALNRGEFDAAAERFERGLDLAREAGDRRAAARLRGHLGRVAVKRGEFESAADSFRESLELARETGDRRCEARSLGDLGHVADKQGRLDEAESLLRRSLEAFRELGDRREQAGVLQALGRVAEKHGDHDAARDRFREALDVYRDVGDPRGRAQCLGELGEVERKQSDFETARDHHRQCLDVYRTLGDRHGQAGALGNLGSLEQMDCEFAQAREYFRRSLELKRELGDRHGQAKSLGNLGLVADEEGRFEAAREYLGECLDLFRELGDRYGEAKSLYLLGLTSERAGDVDAAREYVQRGLDLERELGNRRGEAKALDMLGRVARVDGDPSAAREHHRAALELFRDLDNPLGQAECLLNLGLADLETDGETGRDRFERALAAYADVDDPVGTRRCRALLGATQVRDGDPEAGRERLEAALSYLEPAGVTPAALEVLRRHIEAERERGDAGRVADLCERASAIVDDTDAALGRQREEVARLCDRVRS